jgi:hypothetical protein
MWLACGYTGREAVRFCLGARFGFAGQATLNRMQRWGSGGWAQDVHLIGSNAIEELEAFVVEAGQP